MKYHNITHCDQNNGDGFRVGVWVSGCPHHCVNCQNPETWSEHSGILFDEDAKDEIFSELSLDYIDGITLSGGDPLFLPNRKEIGELIKEIKCKFPNKTVWMYTGFTWEEILEMELDFISLLDVIVDGEYVDSLRDISLCWRGSSNQCVVDVKKSLSTNAKVLYCE